MKGVRGPVTVDVGCQKMPKVDGLGGDFAGCSVVPLNGRCSGERRRVAVCHNLREFGMREGRARATISYRSVSGDGRDMGIMVGSMAGM